MRRAALAGPADRAHGGLHFREPLHSRRADGRAARAGAAVRGRRRDRRSRRRGAAGAGKRPAAPVGAGKIARQKLTYRVLGSAFHDGTRTNAADLLYSYMFAYRWGAASDGDDASDPLIAAATAAMRAQPRGHAGRWDRHHLELLPASAISNSSRELFVIEVYSVGRRPSTRSRTRPSRRRGARCPGICWY